MKTAVIYARYSSDNQTEQSIEGQLRVCEQYAKNNDILILDTYIDRAMTGTNDNRPDFQKMIKASNDKEFQYILVYKIDRFSRNKYETAKYKKILKDNGVKLLSAMENIPDTPEGIILESLLEGMAEYYSAELAQKVKRGMRETRLKGNYQGGYIPYGFRVENKKFVIDEEQGEIVKEMFTRYASGIVVNQIINDLAEKGCLNHGKLFNPATVHGMLRNEIYAGVYRFKDEVHYNMYPAIVSRDIFDKVQERKKANIPGRETPDDRYLFRNKLICGYCGKPISADSGRNSKGKKFCYYKCIGRKKYHNGCIKSTLKREDLEEFLIGAIISELKKDENMRVIIQNVLQLQENNEKMGSTICKLQRKKRDCEAQLDNLIKAITSGIINRTTNKKMQELEKEIDEIDKQLLIEQSKLNSKVTEEDIKTFYNNALSQEAIVIITCLVKEIVLYNDKFEITFNNLTSSPESQGFLFCRKFGIMKVSQNILLEYYI